jgi:uncharacterized protein YciI
MLAAVLCRVDPDRERERLNFRAEHLVYMAAHKRRIFAGGPMLSASGAPETMILIVEGTDLDEVRDFINDEPYNRHGVFDEVTIRAWSRVLPEAHPGALDEALSSEQARR